MIEIATPAGGPPWYDPEWLKAAAGVVTALLGGVATLLGILVQRVRALSAKVEVVKASSADAADAATASRDQVQNDHSINLRDDLDRKNAAVMDAIAAVATQLERADKRTDRVEERLDALREDLSRLDQSAHDSHVRIHERIDRMKDRCENC